MKTLSIDSQIEEISAHIMALPGQLNRAAILALNRTAEWLKGKTASEVSRAKRIKLKLIRDRIRIARANKQSLQTLLNCNFGGILARDLGPMKQTPAGASVAGQVFPGAFIATLQKKVGKSGMYRRVGKERFPVRAVRMPIKEATDILVELLEQEAGDVFKRRFLHEIKRITGRAA
jgi:hypothetical protein